MAADPSKSVSGEHPHLTPIGEPPPPRNPQPRTKSHAANPPGTHEARQEPNHSAQGKQPTQDATTLLELRNGAIVADAVAKGAIAN